jgi:hypothetical protein
MATSKNYNDIYIPKSNKQLSFKSRLKVFPFTNLPLDKWGYFWFTFQICLVLIFLEVNICCNNKGVGWFTIMFPPIFMLLVWFYMHDIR